MKRIRIFSLLLLLALSLSGCSNIHHSVITRTPVLHSICKADMPGAPTEEDLAALDSDIFSKELPVPLHLIPRELFQTATNEWIEYIPTIGGGACYLFSYDAGEEIISYVILLDITCQSMKDSHVTTKQIGEVEYSFYGTRQDVQIRLASNTAVKWNKETGNLTVWADPPFTPEIKATIQMEKEEHEGDNVGTVLNEWSLSARVADPKDISDKPGFFTNVIAEMSKLLFSRRQIPAIEELSYGIIKDAEHRGEISYWSDYREQEHTNDESDLITARGSFQNNYLYQSYNYDGTALGGVSITHNGKLKNEGDYVLIIGRFTGTDPQIARQIKWNINISLNVG